MLEIGVGDKANRRIEGQGGLPVSLMYRIPEWVATLNQKKQKREKKEN